LAPANKAKVGGTNLAMDVSKVVQTIEHLYVRTCRQNIFIIQTQLVSRRTYDAYLSAIQ